MLSTSPQKQTKSLWDSGGITVNNRKHGVITVKIGAAHANTEGLEEGASKG